MINERQPILNQPGGINPRGSSALYSPRESYTKLALSSQFADQLRWAESLSC